MKTKPRNPASNRFNNAFLHLSAILAFSLLGGCGTPKWIENPKATYPENEYLSAVGEGDTRRAAENAAAANLARIFEAHIESDERLLDKTHETGTDFTRTSDFTTDISVLSSQTLYNIRHAEAWKDETGRYHAIAYLNRRETGRIYRDKIDTQNARINFLLGHTGQTADPLRKFALLRAANRHAAENEILLRQLKVIHPPSVPDMPPGYFISSIQRNLANTANKIRVDIKIKGDANGRITACLQELITRYGFGVGKPSVLDIDGHVAVTDTGERNGRLVFVRYELAAQIKDADGTIIATMNNKGRESHFSLPGAHARSFRTLENTINADGAKNLDAYFDSLVEQPR